MSLITIEEAKKQLNILFDDDNDYLAHLITVAEISVENHCNISLSGYSSVIETITGTTGTTLQLLPAPIKHAILLLISHLYSNREIIAFNQVQKIPYTLEYLLQPYINY